MKYIPYPLTKVRNICIIVKDFGLHRLTEGCMFEKNMKYAFLVDIYGDLLDPNAKAVMEAYYNDDLSLAEIAEGIGISRQGVRHSIKHSEEALDRYDACLHLSVQDRILTEVLERIRSVEERLRASDDPALRSMADTLADASIALHNNR